MIGAVPLFGYVMADTFDSSFEKVTCVESESDLIIEKNITDTFKVNEHFVKVSTEEKNVIRNAVADRHKLSFIEVNFVCLSN